MNRLPFVLLAGLLAAPESCLLAQTAGGGVKQVLAVPGAGRETFCAAFSPDGQALAAGGQGLTTGEVKIFNLATGEESQRLTLSEPARAVAFSRDGSLLAASSSKWAGLQGDRGLSQKLTVWDLSRGNELYTLESVQYPDGWSFSPDGKQIATANTDKTVTVWDAATGADVFSFAPEELKGLIGFLRWCPAGNEIFGAEQANPGRLRVWDGGNGKELRRIEIGATYASSFEFNRDGRRMAVEVYREGIRVWDPVAGKALAQAPYWRVTHSSKLAFSPNGKLIALRGAPANYDKSGPIKVWSGETGKELFEIKDRAPSAILFSPDSSRLAGVAGGDGVVVWQVARPDPDFRPSPPAARTAPEKPAANAPSSAAPTEAVTAGDSRPATAAMVPRPLVLKAHEDPAPGDSADEKRAIVDLALSPEQTKLASVSGKGEVLLWDLATGESTPLAAEGGARRVLFTADGKTLLAGNGTQVSAWDVETTAGKGSFGAATGSEYGWHAAADGSAVATLDYPGDGISRYRFWSVAAPETPLVTFDVKQRVECLAVSRGGVMAAVGEGNDVRLFDLTAKKEIDPIRGLPSAAAALVFHPNGKVLVAASSGGDLQFWDVSKSPARLVAKQDTDWSPHGQWFFSADGRMLVLAHNQVQFWEAATRSLRAPIVGLTRRAALSDDGKTIIGLTKDTTSLVADAATGQVRTLIEVALPNGEPAYQWGASGAYAISRDGGFAAIGTKSGAIEVRPLVADAGSTETVVFHLKTPEVENRGGGYANLPQIGFSADGEYVVYRRNEWTAIGEISSGKLWFTSEPAAPGSSPEPLQLASHFFKPAEGALIALAVGEKSVWKYDLSSGRVTRNPADRREYYSFQISPDESQVAAFVKPPSKPVQLALMSPDDGKLLGEPLLADATSIDADFATASWAFSPDGGRLAAAIGRNIRVWDLVSRQEKLINAEGDWTKVFLIENGATVVGVTRDKSELKLFDLETGQAKGNVDLKRLHTGKVLDAAVSPVESVFASVGENGEVLLRDLASGDLLARFAGHQEGVDSAAFSPDGKVLATAAAGYWRRQTPKERAIRLWKIDGASLPKESPSGGSPLAGAGAAGISSPRPGSLPSPREIASIEVDLGLRPGSSKDRAAMEFSPDASLLAVGIGPYGSPTHIFDVARKERKWTSEELQCSRGPETAIRPYQFASDSRTLLSWSGNGRGFVALDLATGKVQASHDPWAVARFAFAPDGKTIAFGGSHGSGNAPILMLLDRDTFKETGPKIEASGGALTALAYSPDGSLLASAVKDRISSRVQLLDPATLAVQATLAEHPAPSGGSAPGVRQIAFSPDGKSLWFSLYESNRVEVWSVAERRLLRSSDSATLRGYTPIAFVGSSALMAFYHNNSDTYIIYDVATDKARSTFEGREPWDISADGRVLAVFGEEGAVVWDLLRGKPLPGAAAHGDTVVDAAVSDNGRLLATVALDNTVKIWSLDGAATLPDARTAVAPDRNAASRAPAAQQAGISTPAVPQAQTAKPSRDSRSPALAGQWANPGDWGTVKLQGGPDAYTGTYTGTYNGQLGSLRLERAANGFQGEWWESDKRRRGTLELQVSGDGNTLLVDWRATGPSAGGGKSTWKRGG